MKFGIVTQTRPLQRTDRQNFEFLKIQDGGGRHLENHKMAISPQRFGPIFTKFGMLMQNGSLNRCDH